MFNDFKSFNNITKFLNSLNYWQQVNLFTTLLQAESDISFNDAKSEALIIISDDEKMEFKLSQAINSPSPRRDYRLKQEKFNHELDSSLLDTLIKSKE